MDAGAAEDVQLFARKKRKHAVAEQPEQPGKRHAAAEQQHQVLGGGGDDPQHQHHQQQQQQRRPPTQQHVEQPAAAGGDAEASEVTFRSLGVSDWLCAVLDSLGITQPTQVQAGCIPAVLAGRNVIGTAQTGSGKTAAFALPILQQLAHDPFGVFALVLTPTRELAMQLGDQFKAFGAGMSVRVATIIGGMEQQAQALALKRKPHVVVATPGRLAALLEADGVLASGFSRLRHLVMDEADRLLDASFEADLRLLLGVLPPPGRRQTLLFSATLTASLVKLQQAALEDAHVFQAYEGLQTASGLTEQYCFIPHKVKDVYLTHLLTRSLPALAHLAAPAPAAGKKQKQKQQAQEQLEQEQPEQQQQPPPQAAQLRGDVASAIVFVSTCKGCRLLEALLKELGLPAASLHSGKSQAQRLAALASFKSARVPLLVATDVAARGLDIPSVGLVVNYDLPRLAADYVHRVGRTARAGRGGWALSFVTQYDVELVAAIEGHIGHKLSECVLDEAAALAGISRVYGAKKAAALALLAREDKAAVGSGGGRQRAKK